MLSAWRAYVWRSLLKPDALAASEQGGWRHFQSIAIDKEYLRYSGSLFFPQDRIGLIY